MRLPRLLEQWTDVEVFPPASVVFSEQDPAELLYVILEGEVDLTLHGEPLGTEGPGGLIGEMAMIDAAVDNATATARGEVRLARISPDEFRQLLAGDSAFSLHVMAVLANRLRAVNEFVARRLGRPAG